MPSTPDIPALISQMKSVIANAPEDEKLKKELYETARKLVLAVESSLDTVKRISFGPLQLAVAKVAYNNNLFEFLVKCDIPVSAEDLNGIIGGDPVLFDRILRFLASYGMIDEASEGKYLANHITKSLTMRGHRAGIEHHFDFDLACWQALPKYLQDNKYQNPTDIKNTPFQMAYKTHLPVFEWVAATRPDLAWDFDSWMSAQHQATWLDVFPLAEISRDEKSEAPLFVDIGGGIGHQCVALKKKMPGITRRIVVQDLAHAIEYAISFEGVEAVVHDFFDEQPIKGASFYYLRNVLHDWPDKKCLKILRNTKAAMSPTSVILVDEMILPNTGAHWQAAHLDIAMMSTLAAMERTQTQWKKLFAQAGLEVREVFNYEENTGDSVMVVVPNDRQR